MMAGPNGETRIAFTVSNAPGLPQKLTSTELRIDVGPRTSCDVLVFNLI